MALLSRLRFMSHVPKIRKKTRSITSSQKDLARSADPNGGRCLVTNRPQPVQLCHLVTQATDRKTLMKLECAWGLGYGHFELNSRYNMMHLRNDWHFLFDQSRWVLVPEMEILRKLSKIYVDDKCTTSDITKLFAEPTYRYYVLPAPALQEPICRFSDVNNYDHKTHLPPFSNLGPLTSHIHPHLVVFNAGEKLSSSLAMHVSKMILTLRQIVPPSSDAPAMVVAIQDLYRAWTEVQVPNRFYATVRAQNRFDRRSSEGRNDRSQGGGPPRCQGPGSTGHYDGAQQRAILPFQLLEDDDSSNTIPLGSSISMAGRSKARASRKVGSQTGFMTRGINSSLPTSMSMLARLLRRAPGAAGN